MSNESIPTNGQQQFQSSSSSSSSIIASSVRIFKRHLSTGGIVGKRPLYAGGIGEVGTSPAHRKRGLTTLLLQDAIRVMRGGTTTTLMNQTTTTTKTGGGGGSGSNTETMNTMRMDCSLLHAGPAFVPVYQKIGNYKCVTSRWSVLTVNLRRLFSSSSPSSNTGHQLPTTTTCRLAQFPNDTPTLQRIHKTYSEDRFVGCIVRSERYWNEYLAKEIGDSLFVVTTIRRPPSYQTTTTQDDEDSTVTTTTPDDNNKNDDYTTPVIVAWMAIRTRAGLYQLREFGVDTELATRNQLSTAFLVSELLTVALEHNQMLSTDQLRCASSEGGGGDYEDSIKLHLPHPIIDELQTNDCKGDDNWIDWKAGIVSKDDTGWMYKFFSSDDDDDDDVDVPSNVRDMTHLMEHYKKDHLIWPSDSF